MKLGLGTVQFGLDYGVTNTGGKVPSAEVSRILTLARNSGIDLLDTAAQYGDSEQVIGNLLPVNAPFRIVTKIRSFRTPHISPAQVQEMNEGFEASLHHLKRQPLYGCLVHYVEDLFVQGGECLLEALLRQKAAGNVEKIGVSVYTGEQIDRVLDLLTPDIVQLPINVLDQRLIASGHLSKLKALGVEIHARSIFLQGILLNPLQPPAWFGETAGLLETYAGWLSENDMTPLQGALSFAASLPELDYAVVGVCSTSQLQEILDASRRPERYNFSQFACWDEAIMNPALWPV